MPASGLTAGLIKRRTRHGGSATSDTPLTHYASGPVSHSSPTPGTTYYPMPSGATAATTSATAAATTGVSPAVSAAQAAAEKQQNLLAKYVLQQAKKALVQKQFTFNTKGEVTGTKESPRQFGEDLHQAAEDIRKADYRKAGLSSQQKTQIEQKNSQGKVVPLKGIARMARPQGLQGYAGVKATGTIKASSGSGVGRTLAGQQKAVTGLPTGAQRKATKALGSSRPSFSLSSIVETLGGDPHSLGLSGSPLTSGVGVDPGERLKKTDPKDLAIAAGTIAAPEFGGAIVRGAARLLRFSKEGEAAGAAASDVAKGTPAESLLSKAKTKFSPSQAVTRAAEKKPFEPRAKFKTRLAAAPAIVAPQHKGNNPAQIAEALVKGHVQALEEDPAGTLATTARALPSVLTFPASLAYESGKALTGDTSGLQTLGAETKGFATQVGGQLLSGDPQQVKKAVENEVGLSFLVPIPRVLGGERGVAVREAARGKVSRLTEHLPESLQLSPESPKGIRRRVAVEARQSQRAPEYESAHFKKEVVQPLRKVKGKETINGATVTAGDTIHLVVKYGVHRDDPGRVLSALRDRLPQESAGKGVVTASQALTFLERHPEVLKNKNYWKAVDAAKASGEATLTSPRAKYMGIGDLHNIPRPEDMVPVKAREFTQATTREGALADVKERKATAAKLRRQAHDDSIRAGALKGEKAAKLRVSAKEARRSAQELDSSAKDLSKALSPYTRPGQSLEGKRINYDTQSLREYVQKVQAAVSRHGHEEPAHLPQVTIGHRGAGEVSRRFASGAKAPHVAAMNELSHQHIDNSLRSLVSGGIERPRIQKGWHEFLKRFVATERQKIGGKSVITREQFEKSIRDGEINPKHYVLLPSRDYHQAIKDRFTFTGSMSDDLNRRIAAIDQEHVLMEDTKGTKYVVVHRQAAEELKSMLESPGVVEKVLNANAKLWNRVLLGLSPGWELSQIVAEGLPIGIAHPELLLKPHVVKAGLNMKVMNKLSQDEARSWASLAGESPRIIDQPEQLRPTLPENANKEVGDFVRATSRNPILRGLWSTARARPLGLFDRLRTGKYRSVLMAAELDRDLNGFIRGLRGSLHFSKETAAKLRDLPLHEQMAYLGKHPAEARKLQAYGDDVMGNWDAFSRFERQFAPALIFYPFVRYSLRWTFWSFPLRHPIKAQMLYFLGQMNSDELEKLLGAKPQNWTDYANPILYDKSGPSAIMPFGRRIAPGLSAPVEAAGQGNIAGLLGALNPTLGVPIEALTGVNPLSGQQEATSLEAKGWLALNQLLSMPAPLRALGLKAGPKSSSSVSQAFSNIDPNRQLRSAAMPYLPLSAERYKLQNELDKLLSESGGKPGFSDFLAAVEAGDQAKIKSLIQQYKLSSKASKALDALLPTQPGEAKALSKTGKILNRLQYGAPPKPKKGGDSIFGGGGIFQGGGIFSGGGIFGSGQSKPSHPLRDVLRGVAKGTSYVPKSQARLPNRLAAFGEQGKGPGKPSKPQITKQVSKIIKQVANTGNASASSKAETFAKLSVKYGKKYGIPPSVLFAQQGTESGWGSDPNTFSGSSAGAKGYTQFMPATRDDILQKYGVDAFGSPDQAVHAQALLLRDAGAQNDLSGAIYSYNHAQWYVDEVLNGAKQYAALDKLSGKSVGSTKDKGPYVSPFSKAKSFTQSRTDEGVDYTGSGAIVSPGKAKYLGVGQGPGWASGGGGGSGYGVVEKLLKGPKKGKDIFLYEGIAPAGPKLSTKGPHSIIKKGQTVASFVPGGSIEEGWSDPSGAPLAQPTYSEGDVTAQGTHFQKFLSKTGAASPPGQAAISGTGSSVPYSSSGAISGTTGTTLASSTGSVPASVLSTAKTSIAHADTLSPMQKLRMVQTLEKPGGALKLLGIPGAFTQKGTLTTDGEKILASLSADRLRLLGTTSS